MVHAHTPLNLSRSSMEPPSLKYYNLHEPDDLRVFPVPLAAVRQWDDQRLVYDVRHGDLILRHYSFSRYWFEVNCVLDLSGAFVAEQGAIDWSFNCDVCTPCFSNGHDVYTVDLWIDVLVGPDGRAHVVKDLPDFEVAWARGLLTPYEHEGARHGLQTLIDIICSVGLVSFLHSQYPFGELSGVPHALPMEKYLRERAPLLLDRTERRHHFGKLKPAGPVA